MNSYVYLLYNQEIRASLGRILSGALENADEKSRATQPGRSVRQAVSFGHTFDSWTASELQFQTQQRNIGTPVEIA